MDLPELKGYLLKKSSKGRWQRRYFEATTHYLTYHKTHKREKMLACIDLYRTQGITPSETEPTEFSISVSDQSYVLKADSAEDARQWVEGLQAREQRPEGVPSELLSARSFHVDTESDTSSDLGRRSRRQSGYTGSDTGSASSATSARNSRNTRPSVTHTNSQYNPIVPNASAIHAAAAAKHTTTYPMLRTDQAVSQAHGYQGKPSSDQPISGCCALCTIS